MDKLFLQISIGMFHPRAEAFLVLNYMPQAKVVILGHKPQVKI